MPECWNIVVMHVHAATRELGKKMVVRTENWEVGARNDVGSYEHR